MININLKQNIVYKLAFEGKCKNIKSLHEGYDDISLYEPLPEQTGAWENYTPPKPSTSMPKKLLLENAIFTPAMLTGNVPLYLGVVAATTVYDLAIQPFTQKSREEAGLHELSHLAGIKANAANCINTSEIVVHQNFLEAANNNLNGGHVSRSDNGNLDGELANVVSLVAPDEMSELVSNPLIKSSKPDNKYKTRSLERIATMLTEGDTDSNKFQQYTTLVEKAARNSARNILRSHSPQKLQHAAAELAEKGNLSGIELDEFSRKYNFNRPPQQISEAFIRKVEDIDKS